VLSLAEWHDPVPSASTPMYQMTVRQLLTVPQDLRFVIIYVKDKDMKFATEVQTLWNQTSDLLLDVVDVILSREKFELHA
jgi:hypothetical protein